MYGQAPPAINRFKGRSTSTNTGTVQLAVAPGAGFALWVSKLTISNSHATTRTNVNLLSGSTVIWTTPAPAAGGALEVYPDPIDCNENEALSFNTDDSVSTITVSVAGYKAIVR